MKAQQIGIIFLLSVGLIFIGNFGQKGGDVQAKDIWKVGTSAVQDLTKDPHHYETLNPDRLLYKTKDGRMIGCLEFGPAGNPERWIDCNDIFDRERMTLSTSTFLTSKTTGDFPVGPFQTKNLPKEKFHCPLCGEKGNRLGWIAIGSADQYWSNVGWIPSMDFYTCPKCHLLFWENAKELK